MKICLPAKKVVIHEEQEFPRRESFDLGDEPRHGPHAKIRSVERVYRAKVAGETATSAILDQLDRCGAFPRVEGAPEPIIGERKLVAPRVSGLEPAGGKIRQQSF